MKTRITPLDDGEVDVDIVAQSEAEEIILDLLSNKEAENFGYVAEETMLTIRLKETPAQ